MSQLVSPWRGSIARSDQANAAARQAIVAPAAHAQEAPPSSSKTRGESLADARELLLRFRKAAHRVGWFGIVLGVIFLVSGLLLLSGIVGNEGGLETTCLITLFAGLLVVASGIASCQQYVVGIHLLVALCYLYIALAAIMIFSGSGSVGIIPTFIALHIAKIGPEATKLAGELNAAGVSK